MFMISFKLSKGSQLAFQCPMYTTKHLSVSKSFVNLYQQHEYHEHEDYKGNSLHSDLPNKNLVCIPPGKISPINVLFKAF